ncbi:triose-phosphate isomerase [Pseudoalteromonas piscicida]|uniref:Triosephosphate isomerase n=2 Tax=Pseudoalteromonas TaxID=53246 RepID=A0AAQ2ITH8_PSEO7|nr:MULTISPECIES: triose-phosphate isomerase [Pseudoalteromonas]KJY89752.1 triosephosphate isomerase [Pseudoalteromonas piscicida]TMN36506.1 triose-phosphate isomerase [Pseudoalteromonas piscicida]TMN40102.1 triose-phosphate isomerase [Pseudoalteromonas piscicida]TMN54093.1 triose-phosphate isomerase [Pseudoalteromonas piscicida]TMN55877.1 triose-phosphate isomerase [Pseudoalteromonas piscicida]
MTTRKQIVAGNWKMNGSKALVDQISEAVSNQAFQADVIVFPPAMLIEQAASKGLTVGTQTVSEYKEGAYTGEIQASLAKSLGATYALVGHSERRAIYGESDEDVANKFAHAQEQGLTPILCVGETEEERGNGQTEQVVARQINAVITKLGVAALTHSVIAYEPVWAIGTGKTASPEQAQAVHKFIRDLLSENDKQIAQALRLLYGGSVNEQNSELLFAQDDIDGGLIGGASLKPESFAAICRSAKG